MKKIFNNIISKPNFDKNNKYEFYGFNDDSYETIINKKYNTKVLLLIDYKFKDNVIFHELKSVLNDKDIDLYDIWTFNIDKGKKSGIIKYFTSIDRSHPYSYHINEKELDEAIFKSNNILIKNNINEIQTICICLDDEKYKKSIFKHLCVPIINEDVNDLVNYRFKLYEKIINIIK